MLRSLDMARMVRVVFTLSLAVALTLSIPIVARAETAAGTNGGGAERVGAEAPRLEEEREAKKKEEEERPAKEAAARGAKEREVREAGERAGREAAERERGAKERSSNGSVQCVVPRLRGDSIGAARTALRRSHCELGKVRRPARHRTPLVVGSKLASGAAIAVKLGPANVTHAK